MTPLADPTDKPAKQRRLHIDNLAGKVDVAVSREAAKRNPDGALPMMHRADLPRSSVITGVAIKDYPINAPILVLYNMMLLPQKLPQTGAGTRIIMQAQLVKRTYSRPINCHVLHAFTFAVHKLMSRKGGSCSERETTGNALYLPVSWFSPRKRFSRFPRFLSSFGIDPAQAVGAKNGICNGPLALRNPRGIANMYPI